MSRRTALWLNPVQAAGLELILRAYLDSPEIAEEAPVRPHMRDIMRRLNGMPKDREPLLWPKADVIRAITEGHAG